MSDEEQPAVNAVLATPDLATVLESEQFRRFLDHFPIAIVVAEMAGPERIVYANPAFEGLTGQPTAEVAGQPWSALQGESAEADGGETLSEAVVARNDRVGAFRVTRAERTATVAAYSNVIQDDAGQEAYRLVALVDVSAHDATEQEAYENRIREKDALLREIQHRVKNNLQMITALIRMEARNAAGSSLDQHFDRLAGRVEALHLLYAMLSEDSLADEVDLGIYLSQIASAVMRSHGVEGIRLDLKVDTYPVSVNVAMPAGLVVNEVLTNTLKHAFQGREGGTITLHSTASGEGCRVLLADDGVGLPDGVEWPRKGSLSAMIVRSLRENAKAGVEVASAPEGGTQVTITFTRTASAPQHG